MGKTRTLSLGAKWALVLDFWTMAQDYRKQHRYSQRHLGPYLQPENWDDSVGPKERRRMLDYPMQNVVFFGQVYARLQNRKFQELERARISDFAAFLALYDDLFDETQLSAGQLWALAQDPASFSPRQDKEKVCKELLLRTYQALSIKDSFLAYFHRFFLAQEASRKQRQTEALTWEAIRKLSFDKGGWAMVLFRFLLDPPPSAEEIAACYDLGSWYQILDDIVDIHKDYREGVQTLITRATSVKSMEEELRLRENLAFSKLRSLPYPPRSIQWALRQFFFIGTTGYVHMKHLAKLERQYPPPFDLSRYQESDIQWDESRPEIYWIALGLIGRETY